MNLTDSDILKFQYGSPIFLDDICAIYPAKLGEIVEFGYEKFQTCLSALIANKPILKEGTDKELKQLIDGLTDFQYLLMMATVDKETNEIFREGFRFFCHEEIFFSLEPEQIVVGPIEEKHLLVESKFYDFQYILKRMYFIEQEGEEIIIYEDDDPAVKTLKMQRRKRQQDLAKAKAKKAAKEGNDLKFSDLIGSITINNCGLNMENIWNITYYAFHDQLKRMGWRDQFNINNQAALAGAKLKKNQLKHWIRSIANSEKS